MQGEIVTASRWLGASIVLASGIVVVGLRWVHPSPVQAPATLVASKEPAPLDADILRQAAEFTIEAAKAPRSEVEACKAIDCTPMLDALPAGSSPASCLDSPSEAEVIEKLSSSRSDSLSLNQLRRDNVRIAVEKIGEKVDPCKVFPLAGPCQLVHCHYKCSVSFEELYRVDSPLPFNHSKHRVEVVYIDKDHLRRCAEPKSPTPSP
jgi:hypothetical protein